MVYRISTGLGRVACVYDILTTGSQKPIRTLFGNCKAWGGYVRREGLRTLAWPFLRELAGHNWARGWPLCDSCAARAWPVHFPYVGIRVIPDITGNSPNRPYAMVTRSSRGVYGPRTSQTSAKTVRDAGMPCEPTRFFTDVWTRIHTVEPVAKSCAHGFLRQFARRKQADDRAEPVRSPCGARSWPYGHHTETRKGFQVEGSLTGPVRAPCGVFKTRRAPSEPQMQSHLVTAVLVLPAWYQGGQSTLYKEMQIGSEFWTMYNWVQTWGKIKISEVLRATYLA